MQVSDFLTAVLGTDGAQALSKAARRLPDLEAVFLPRAVISWLDCCARLGFEGQVPGTAAQLAKGGLEVDGYSYELGAAQSPERLRAAAALTMAIIEDVSIPEDIDCQQVARLGKSVDTLVKARFVSFVKDLESRSAGSESSSSSGHDLSKGIEDMTKGQGWRSADGLVIPKAGTPERQAWDDQYRQNVAKRFAGGDAEKLLPVRVPVSEHSFGHFVPGPEGAKHLDRYRVPMYQRMLAAGDRLPPLLVERNGKSWRVIDGNARLKAALAHGKTQELDAFELKKGGLEEPGKAAVPRGPEAPEAPVAPRQSAMTGSGAAPQPAPAVSRARGFYKSEVTRICGRCGQSQMRGRELVGCLCIVDIISGADLVQKTEGDRIVLIGNDVVIVALEDQLGLKPGT